MSSDQQDLIVVLDAAELGPRRPVGVLSFWASSEAIAFEYVRSWLGSGEAFALEPRLPLVSGLQYVQGGLPPAILGDTSPDSWGIALLERRAGRRLDAWELLVGVSDKTRMGALRLQLGVDGPFIDDRDPAVPPIAQLRALEAAALAFEEDPDRALEDPNIELLLAPGSSLGGGRPKANFRDPQGQLWIAKFPSLTDRRDTGAWESVYAELAARAGIEVAECQLMKLGPRGRTFAARRFDRDPAGNRRLYASAMTMTGLRDGEEAGYPDLVAAIRANVAPRQVRADLEQLFRRLLFNVMVGNRDDHLRNHGFLRTSEGWRLAPAFDMNPGREQRHHALSFDGSTTVPDFDAAFATRGLYGMSDGQARDVAGEVAAAAKTWQDAARRHRIRAGEVRIVAGVFSALDRAMQVLGEGNRDLTEGAGGIDGGQRRHRFGRL